MYAESVGDHFRQKVRRQQKQRCSTIWVISNFAMMHLFCKRNMLNFALLSWAVVQQLPQLRSLRHRHRWCEIHSRPQRTTLGQFTSQRRGHINQFHIVSVVHCSINKSAQRELIPCHKTSGRATGPKCKLMLPNSPESAHKKFGADRCCIFWVIV